MGRLFARWLKGRGYRVLVADPAGAPAGFAKGSLDSAADADVVVVAASLSRAAVVLSEVVARHPKGLVFDIASVKTPLVPTLEEAVRRGLAIASVHPMFGPDVASFRGHDLIVCDCGNAAAARRTRALFAGSGVKVADDASRGARPVDRPDDGADARPRPRRRGGARRPRGGDEEARRAARRRRSAGSSSSSTRSSIRKPS